MKVSKKTLKNIARIIIIIFLIIAIVILIYAIVSIYGKNRLYNSHNTNKYKKNVAREITGENSQIVVEYVKDNSSYNWMDGDILYNGEIYRYNDEILSFLIMGIDKMGKVDNAPVTDYMDGGQADALFLIVLNPKTEEFHLIGINRNTIANVDTYNHEGEFTGRIPLQVNLQHGYGDGRELSCERQTKVVSELLGNIPIHGYMAINMGAVPVINDMVGGVPVTVMDNTNWRSKVLKENVGKTITLKGDEAYEYVHQRDITVFDSAGDRLDRQKQYLEELIKVVKNRTKQNIYFPVKLYYAVADYVVTNVSIAEMNYLLPKVLKYKFDKNSIISMEGETKKVDDFEEFYPDDVLLKEMIIDIFYEKING